MCPVWLLKAVMPLLDIWLTLTTGRIVRPAKIFTTLPMPDGIDPSTCVVACTAETGVSFLPARQAKS